MKKVRQFLVASFAVALGVMSSSVVAQERNYTLENEVIEVLDEKCDILVNVPILKTLDAQTSNPKLEQLISGFNTCAYSNIVNFLKEATSSIKGANSLALNTTNRNEFELYLLANMNAYSNSDAAKLSSAKYVMYSTWESYFNDFVVTICQDSYVYTGGAHGIRNITLDSYSTETGKRLDFHNAIIDTTYFMENIAKYFCKERRIRQGALKAETGLFYELADLPMPKLIGLDKKGLMVIYEQYEIAPYAAGPVKIVIPFKELGDILSPAFTKVAVKKGGQDVYYNRLHELRKLDEKRRKK